MKITSGSVRATIKRNFTIESDHPVAHMAYSNPPKEVIINSGVIEYTFLDGRWIVKDRWAVDVVGDVLKKDGTRSKNAHSRSAQDAPDIYHSPELVLHEDWAWLQAIIDRLRPNGDLTMSIYREYEVGE